MNLFESFRYYYYEMADSRVKDWPITNTPYGIPLIIVAYIYVVLSYGPRYMKNKQPYSLKTFIKFYNIFQIVANSFLVAYNLAGGWFTELSVFCEPVDYSEKPGPMKLAKAMWWMTLLKLIDLLETLVFVLRKKDNQISFLHVYHHVSSLLICWLSFRYIAGGMSTFVCLVNSFVHVIMYGYYFLSTSDLIVRKKLQVFKPMITVVQMAQIAILTVYVIQSLLPSCKVPRLPGYINLINFFINFSLFFNFYRKSYKIQRTKTKGN